MPRLRQRRRRVCARRRGGCTAAEAARQSNGGRRQHLWGDPGTSINHGGKTNGYTVPNPNAQSNIIAEALRKSGVHPRHISYMEAHGTGTALGDPIEISGLTKAFRTRTADNQYCAIGSVKSNVGHLESAAGVVSIIKVLLQMKHRQLVPSLHSEVLNPNINFAETPFYVQRRLEEWKPAIIEEGACPRNARVTRR